MTRCTHCACDDHGPNQCPDQPPAASAVTEGIAKLGVQEVADAWAILESHGFPPEAVNWPQENIAGKLPVAVDNALTAIVGARDDLLAEVMRLREAVPRSSAGTGGLTPDLMNATTVSCTGLEITIACNDHDTKDALMDVLVDGAYPTNGDFLPIEDAARFLLDRLDEFDPGEDEPEREYHGHVAPAIARLRSALTRPKLCTCSPLTNYTDSPHEPSCPLSSQKSD